MSEADVALGILFADISDSALLYRQYGDEEAFRIVSDCLDLLGETASSVCGTVVERIGDEVLCTFPTAELTAQAAVEMQKLLDEAKDSARLPVSVNVRIGLHFGRVRVVEGRPLGNALYTAHRTASLAKAQQILTTPDTVETLGDGWQGLCRFVDRASIKGKRGLFDVYEIVWDELKLTVEERPVAGASLEDHELLLSHDGKQITVNEEHPTISVGRNEECDLVVTGSGVSRFHARFECRKGYVALIDLSTNGTYVTRAGESRIIVLRDEIHLSESGTISLGIDDATKQANLLRYEFRDRPRQSTSRDD